jgi:opacity protein-like surface antigen
MTRSARFAMVLAAAFSLGISTAQAQTPTPTSAPPAGPEGKFSAARFSAEVAVAATLGHRSSSSFGVELDYRLTDRWVPFFEVGRMRNVATSDLDARAQKIADALQGSANPVEKATYYDFGSQYRFAPHGMWHPYAAIGVGAASVTTSTSIQTGTSEVAVSFGPDLQGTVTKPFMMIGGGVTVPFAQRYYVDGSYRYGRIFAREGVIDADTGISTQRVQIGVGIHF